ncbi:unnamed protein product [Sphagnum troendelagicum]|uniref:Uncharacterized protein n=1 Tax=Sphagnum troendelagicum TaxID=128251 RepID=A0ABP0UXA5_9BRYO
MEEEGDSTVITLDMEFGSWGCLRYQVPTASGPISVVVCGDQDKPALLTYPDVGLNYVSCFEGLFSDPEASSVLYHNFCIYHVDALGHEVSILFYLACAPDQPSLSVDDLADQLAEVLDFFGLDEVIGLGVTGGAYILTHFALKYRERALGLILVSPLCQTPSWTEWIYNKAIINLLYFCGMSGFVKDTFLQRYFSQEARTTPGAGPDVIMTYRRHLDDVPSRNVMRYMQAINQRVDLSERVKKLKCRTLIIVGEHSPFHHEALHLSTQMHKRYNALIEVQACGSLVTEEQPHAMFVPMELFLMGYSFYQRPVYSLSSTPTSPLSAPCVSPELLSPESLGLKLKPIKTRVSEPEEENC